jgi:hypothetical protein
MCFPGLRPGLPYDALSGLIWCFASGVTGSLRCPLHGFLFSSSSPRGDAGWSRLHPFPQGGGVWTG